MSGVSTATILAGASLALTAVGTVMSIGGQQQQAQSNQGLYAYQAAVARNNQTTANTLAVDAETRGKAEEDRQRRKTALIMGTQQAALAAQGTDLEGSPTDILGDTAAVGELDALTIRSNAAREAWGYRVKGVEYGNEVALANARVGSSGLSALGVGASLIGGAGAVADKWYRYSSSQKDSFGSIDDLIAAKGIG